MKRPCILHAKALTQWLSQCKTKEARFHLLAAKAADGTTPGIFSQSYIEEKLKEVYTEALFTAYQEDYIIREQLAELLEKK